MGDPVIFSVTNQHAEPAPAWVSLPPEGSRGYFENEHGEQWIAEATRDEFRVTGGDIGWETVTVPKPDYRLLLSALDASIGKPGVAFEGILLGASEKQWMRAMLLSATFLSA